MAVEFSLSDDGTLDTVVECRCTICEKTWEERIDGESASYYRDPDTGEMIDLDGLMDGYDVFCQYCE